MFIVVGTPGAGKSSVLEKFKERHSDWEIVNYGTYMFEIAKGFGIKDRDEMRKASLELQRKIQKAVGEKLSAMEGKIILDTHATVKTPRGYLPGLPFSIISKLKVEGIILITASAEEIVERRKTDKSRRRDAETKEEIEEHDRMNKTYCSIYSAISGAPFSIIYNRQGKLEEAVSKLEEIVL